MNSLLFGFGTLKKNPLSRLDPAQHSRHSRLMGNTGRLEQLDNQKKGIEIDALFNKLQENPTDYESYVYGKYRAAASLGFPRPLQEQDR